MTTPYGEGPQQPYGQQPYGAPQMGYPAAPGAVKPNNYLAWVDRLDHPVLATGDRGHHQRHQDRPGVADGQRRDGSGALQQGQDVLDDCDNHRSGRFVISLIIVWMLGLSLFAANSV